MEIKFAIADNMENLKKVIIFNRKLDEEMKVFLDFYNFSSDYDIESEFWQSVLKGDEAVAALAEADGKTVGMTFLKFKDKKSYIISLIVEKQFRNRGIGGALLNFAKSVAKERGCEMIFLNVLKKNTEAKKLYERNGFEDFAQKMIFKLKNQ